MARGIGGAHVKLALHIRGSGKSLVRALYVEACIDNSWVVTRQTTGNAHRERIAGECATIGFYSTRDEALAAALALSLECGLPVAFVDAPDADPTKSWEGSAA